MDTVLIATLFCVLLATGILFLDGRNRIVLSVLLVLNLAFWYLVVGRGMDILYAGNVPKNGGQKRLSLPKKLSVSVIRM